MIVTERGIQSSLGGEEADRGPCLFPDLVSSTYSIRRRTSAEDSWADRAREFAKTKLGVVLLATLPLMPFVPACIDRIQTQAVQRPAPLAREEIRRWEQGIDFGNGIRYVDLDMINALRRSLPSR